MSLTLPRLQTIVRLLFLLCCLMGAGCASLPNVGPFVEASNQLRSAVSTSGATVVAELRLIPNGVGSADRLQKQWESRNKAFEGVAVYANSLQSIVEAGNQGAKSAEKVADSITKLAGAAGVAMPGSPEAVGVVTDIGKYIYAQIALARAAKSLQKSMETAQPAVEAICKLMVADLADVLRAAANKAEQAVDLEYNALIGYRKDLIQELGGSDPKKAETLDRQAKLGGLLEASNGWYAEYASKIKAIDERRRAGRALIKESAQVAVSWGVAHGNLLTALRERRPVNVESLVQASVEIQTLIRKVQAL